MRRFFIRKNVLHKIARDDKMIPYIMQINIEQESVLEITTGGHLCNFVWLFYGSGTLNLLVHLLIYSPTYSAVSGSRN